MRTWIVAPRTVVLARWKVEEPPVAVLLKMRTGEEEPVLGERTALTFRVWLALASMLISKNRNATGLLVFWPGKVSGDAVAIAVDVGILTDGPVVGVAASEAAVSRAAETHVAATEVDASASLSAKTLLEGLYHRAGCLSECAGDAAVEGDSGEG